MNFNSHAHVERDKSDNLGYYFGTISTHTLTWSVTINAQGKHAISINFNSHAHVERDKIRNRKNQGVYHFNSHAHVERD